MRLRVLFLTLAAGMGIAGVACADESGSWLPRWLAPTAVKVEPAKSEKSEAPSLPLASRKKQAAADRDRRIEILDRIREFAVQKDDDETRRQADLLEQRVWDVYHAAVNANSEPVRVKVDVNRGNR